MAKSTTIRKTPEQSADARDDVRPVKAGADALLQRLARARTANEMTSVIGLKPIKGRSGPKIAY